MIIRMPIDIKSLYLNIKNDNLTGHTPTVATPLKQGKSVHEELAQILQLPENIPSESKEKLTMKLLSKSRADVRIVRTYLFEKIAVNGIMIDAGACYCIYIREEIDPKSVHFGRQKVHYPQVLDYEDEEIVISNGRVIKAISKALNDYAFIVQAFEYDTATGVLNFDALIVGENGVPYSKVFLIRRGVGDKFSSVFKEYLDDYDMEIIAIRDRLGYDSVNPENFMDCMNENRQKAISIVTNSLNESGKKEWYELSRYYPYALFDIEVKNKAEKEYLIVRFTSTQICYFNLPISIIRFISAFSSQVKLILVTDINGNPSMHEFTSQDLEHMKKTICSVTYEYQGV
ncbi:MAG: hypothetical protein IJ088_03550 [Clostridia bacterium]|nr:hypothetical protein [Clostridia bacterium]